MEIKTESLLKKEVDHELLEKLFDIATESPDCKFPDKEKGTISAVVGQVKGKDGRKWCAYFFAEKGSQITQEVAFGEDHNVACGSLGTVGIQILKHIERKNKY